MTIKANADGSHPAFDVVQVLNGHSSPETAYIVNDYPYGFCLRCKIRYWIEDNGKKGVRFGSQTTNPKVAGEVWNKPKYSTYSLIGVLYLDSQGHVQYGQLGHYSWADSINTFKAAFGPHLNEADSKMLRTYEAVSRRLSPNDWARADAAAAAVTIENGKHE